MSSPDYKLKSEVMKLQLHKKIGYIDRCDFLKARDGVVVDKDIDDKYFQLCLDYDFKLIKEGRKINQASYRRSNRLKDRITGYMRTGQCIFVTLTFTDEVLNNTSESTRRQYVSRYLKSISNCYVANIDYGVDDRYTHREHYHAVIMIDYINVRWKYGFSWFEKIHKTSSEKKLAKYITKLCNHAIKESTKRCCYIYSRRFY